MKIRGAFNYDFKNLTIAKHSEINGSGLCIEVNVPHAGICNRIYIDMESALALAAEINRVFGDVKIPTKNYSGEL